MKTAIKTRRDALLLPLHNSYLDVMAEVRATETSKPQAANKHADKKISHAILDMKSLTGRIDDSFFKLRQQASIKLETYRAFKWMRAGGGKEITRSADVPKIENTLAILLCVAFVEAGLAGWVYALEGKMSLVQGFGYGAIFSFCNISTALGMGWILRYACITYHDQFKIGIIRSLAWLGITALFSLLVVLIVSGARVRGFARNTDIWNFTELPMLATFHDAYTILFLAIAIMSSAYAIFKGATAFSDFIPGFTAVEKEVIALDKQGEELAEQFEELIEQTADMAIEEFEQAQGDPEDREEYGLRRDAVLEQCEQHNIDVREAEMGLQDLYDDVVDIKHRHPSMVTKMPHLLLDIEAIEKQLELPPIPPRSEDLITKLEQETQLALAACKEALMAYLNADKSPDHDEREEGFQDV